MQASRDIQLEKFLEAMYDHMWSRLPSDLRKECEALRFVGELLVEVKSENNTQVMLEMGMIGKGVWRCPCQKGCGRPSSLQPGR